MQHNKPAPFLDLLFHAEDFPTSEHPAWDVWKSREFKLLLNFLILNKLSSLVPIPKDKLKIEDLIDLIGYATIMNGPEAILNFRDEKETMTNESSDINKFEN